MSPDSPSASQVPKSLKQWAGHIAAGFVNLRLRGDLTREQRNHWAGWVNRYPRWLGSVDEELLVPTEFGFSIYCDRRSGIGQTLMAEGMWEGLLSRTLLACLGPGDTAIDIGANIGYDTLLMSSAVGDDGLVFAFEPEARNLALLLRNVNAARNKNVIVQTLALSDTSSLARITSSDIYYSGRPNLRPEAQEITKPVLAGRLDQLLQLSGLGRIAFVKMDIEGFEWKAIQGMGSLIERVDCLSCEINSQFLAECGSSPRDIFDWMQRNGFQSFCASHGSNARWEASNHDFANVSSSIPYYDAFFCRQVSDTLRPLVA